MINANHQIVVNYISKHPLLERVFDRRTLEDLGERRHQESPKWPELYLAIIDRRRVNLDTFQAGFSLVMSKTQGQPRSDCISRLRDTNSVGTVFEVTCIGSLIPEFGEENVTPYPEFPNGQRGEVLLDIEGQHICLEASVLSFGEEDNQGFEAAKGSNGVSVGSMRGIGKGRVILKLEEKMSRYHPDFPNIFLLSQYSCLPPEKAGISVAREHLNRHGKEDPARNFTGVFYFDRFRCLEWLQNAGCRSKARIPDHIIRRLTSAFGRMPPEDCEK